MSVIDGAVNAFQCSSASRKFLNPRARPARARRRRRFSALQRAENSSILQNTNPMTVNVTFQCSSASRKFLNRTTPSSDLGNNKEFQCSSASRKFLNRGAAPRGAARGTGFSALQRAENSSMRLHRPRRRRVAGFSALQRAENSSIWSLDNENAGRSRVSVLFSEPKIPQCVQEYESAG